jgi:small subunit ribosomal protein S15
MNTHHEMMTTNWKWWDGTGASANPKNVEMLTHHKAELAAGVGQAKVMAKVVNLRNANAAGIAFESRRRVIEAFSEPGKPNDTARDMGRAEMQAALLTKKWIRIDCQLGKWEIK